MEPKQAEIIPAIMAADRQQVEKDVSRVIDLVPLVQIDVMDGKFVPKRSWPYDPSSGDSYTADFTKILAEEDGLPRWQELDYEIDLMVARPEDAAEKWILAGAKRLIFHIESDHKIEGEKKGDSDGGGKSAIFELVSDLRKRFPIHITDSLINLEIGLAVNVDTDLSRLAPYLKAGEESINFVQCMGISKVGFQKQLFNEGALTQVAALRKLYPSLIISVDGGVNVHTAKKLVDAGANRLVSGSALFNSDNLNEAFDALCDAADGITA